MKQYVTADKYLDEDMGFEVNTWENNGYFKAFIKNERKTRTLRVYEFETETGDIREVNPKDLEEYKIPVNIKNIDWGEKREEQIEGEINTILEEN